MKKYYIKVDALEMEIFLRDNNTSHEIIKNLPLRGDCQKWGKEYYFYTKLKIPIEKNAKQIINIGEIVYWPGGDAIAIGFGKTPISVKDEIKLADKCNVWADTKFDLKKLENIVNPKNIAVYYK